MINIHNISNLEMFNQEGYSVSCPKDLQEAIQAGIVKKVRKLFNTEGFLALIPNFDPTEDTKLRIHLTKDGITIQLLEKDTSNPKVDTPYTKNDLELSEEVKTRKEKIIKKIDSLLKKPSALDSSARLESKVHPLFIPSQPNKEQAPSKIYFDATLSNPQIQQLHARIEDLQNQLNKKNPYPEELKVIKEQLVFLNQAILNLSLKQENITYPHTEEYTLINKLVDNQQDIYRALLDLLSRNLNQTSNTIPQNLSVIQDTGIKEMAFKSKENTSLEELVDLKEGLKELSNLQKEKDDLEIANATLQENLLSKEVQIATLEQKIQNLPTDEALYQLQSQLETLQNEKANLQSQQDGFISQLEKLTKSSKGLKSSNATLQENLLSKEAQIATLEQKIQNLPTDETIYQLQSQLEMLQNDRANLQVKLSDKNEKIFELNKEIQSLSEVHQALQNQLRDEKEIVSILETAAIPTISSKVELIETIIEEEKNKMEQNLSLLENNAIPENLLIPTSDYYTLTPKVLQEESFETATEITTLQAEIKYLREELEDIRPIVYNTTRKIEKTEKSNKDLTLELSKKTKAIEDLEEEKKFLESRLNKSESQLKDLQKAQYIFKEQQKEISLSSEENNDLLEELEKIQEKLSLEKRARAELEKTHQDQLEKLKDLYNENVLEKMEHINTKIANLQQQKKNTCFTLAQVLTDYIRAGSITEDVGQSIVGLMEEAFNNNTTEYKALLDLVSSEEEDFVSSEESASSDEYNEDSYLGS